MGKESKFDELEFDPYIRNSDLYQTKGANPNMLNAGDTFTSQINKLHLIKLFGLSPDEKDNYTGINKHRFSPKTFSDLCRMELGACQYDPEDFLYCKNIGFPINRLITLRRFPIPCTDNIYDKHVQAEPDIARLISYTSQDINKLEDLLGFSYAMKWKELTAEMEQANMQGNQNGFSGMMQKFMPLIDPVLSKNKLQGENKLNYDPKHDQNKAYGPVDSIITTHIRDIGLDFDKEFEITFEYELRSIGGRTPEYAMKDILSNILACTYNNGKFWPGSRYWVGERPSNFFQHFDYLNPDTIDEFLSGASKDLKSAINGFKSGGSAIAALKNVMTNGLNIALGKILDKVGRASILSMNSLLNAEPTGFWHLTIGNPDNPTMCIGNLILMGTDISFPSDSLSYGDFPTKLVAKIKLKPGQSKDRAGIEMMFNFGKSRMYYAPKKLVINKNKPGLNREVRSFFDFDINSMKVMVGEAFDFLDPKQKIEIITKEYEMPQIASLSNQSNDNKLKPTSNIANMKKNSKFG